MNCYWNIFVKNRAKWLIITLLQISPTNLVYIKNELLQVYIHYLLLVTIKQQKNLQL